MLDKESREDTESRFVEHVRDFQDLLREGRPLGKRPADLLDVLARMAIAGPATDSLRATLRVATPEVDEGRLAFLAGAARAGLGFHQYCHRFVNWNLPSNPVDLEQREGSVHRYKGHVVRRNLAKCYGLSALPRSANGPIDPWEPLFERACQDRSADANDLEPYWIFDTKGGYKIERQIPLLPLSREVGQLAWLKKTLVAYRSVIGQPRQEELTEFLLSRLAPDELAAFAEACSIDLSPPILHSTLGRKSPA